MMKRNKNCLVVIDLRNAGQKRLTWECEGQRNASDFERGNEKMNRKFEPFAVESTADTSMAEYFSEYVRFQWSTYLHDEELNWQYFDSEKKC